MSDLWELTRRDDVPIIEALWLAQDKPRRLKYVHPREGTTALWNVSRKGIAVLVECFIFLGADPGFTPFSRYGSCLYYAAHYGHLRCVQLLVEAGAPVDVSNAVAAAAEMGRVDVLAYLISKGAGVENVCEHGLRPLHLAAQWGHLDCIRMLLDAGADTESRTDDDQLPIHAAIRCEKPDVVRLLYKPSMRKSSYDTPLHFAAHVGSVAMIALLIELGHVVDVHDAEMCTPLAYAVFGGHTAAVRELLRAGTTIGLSFALLHAVVHKLADLAQVAIECGATRDMVAESHQAVLAEMLCANCDAAGDLLRCARCKKARYCDAACQREHWPLHKRDCA